MLRWSQRVQPRNSGKCNPAQAYNNPGRQHPDLLLQIREAIQQFRRRGLVGRRHTSAGCGEVQTLQPKSIVLRERFCTCGKSRSVQRRKEERSGRISGEVPARAIGTVRARCQTHGEDSRPMVPEPGDGSAPVLPIHVRPTRGAGNCFPPLHQARALAACHDASFKAFKIHSIILL